MPITLMALSDLSARSRHARKAAHLLRKEEFRAYRERLRLGIEQEFNETWYEQIVAAAHKGLTRVEIVTSFHPNDKVRKPIIRHVLKDATDGTAGLRFSRREYGRVRQLDKMTLVVEWR